MPKKIEWKNMRQSPEETVRFNEEAAKASEQIHSDARNPERLLEGTDSEVITWTRAKAKQVAEAASYNEQIAALAHIDQVIRDIRPDEMITALGGHVPAPEGKSQAEWELEMALAFLTLTDNESN